MEKTKLQRSPVATLKEACQYLKISISKGQKEWPRWKEQFCVRVIRDGRALKFYYSDLDSMLSQMEIN